MNRLMFARLLRGMVLAVLCCSGGASWALCSGKLPTPAEFCTNCLMPMTIMSVGVNTNGDDDMNTGNDATPICCIKPCPGGSRSGIDVGYFEPVIQVDAVTQPKCWAGLGSGDKKPGESGGGQGAKSSGGDKKSLGPLDGHGGTSVQASTDKQAFYHTHWYPSPAGTIYSKAMQTALKCQGTRLETLPFISEIDPTWNNDALAAWKTPWVFLLSVHPYVSLGAQLSCVADCAAATINMPLYPLFYCAGCYGVQYPLSGSVSHAGGVASALLIAQRAAAFTTTYMFSHAHHGSRAQCAGHWVDNVPFPNRQQYKLQLVHPQPNNDTNNVKRQCCHAMGRSVMAWNEPRPNPPQNEYPVLGESYSFFVYQRRSCCSIVKDC
jgi:conjugal transfer pilus assembly protein TraU